MKDFFSFWIKMAKVATWEAFDSHFCMSWRAFNIYPPYLTHINKDNRPQAAKISVLKGTVKGVKREAKAAT